MVKHFYGLGPDGRPCRHFRHDRPCGYGVDCRTCGHFSPYDEKILVVQLGGLAIVVYATALLPALKRAHPNSYVVWLTEPTAVPLLQHHPFLDEVLPYTFRNALRLQEEEYDLVINLDKDLSVCALVRRMRAKEKRGFLLDRFGHLAPANEEALYLFRLGLDDELKLRLNRKTFPEMICELARLPYEHDPPLVVVPSQEQSWAARWYAGQGLTPPIVGFNPGGCGTGKLLKRRWPVEKYITLAHRLERRGIAVVVFGDRGDADRMQAICAATHAHNAGPDNSLLQFAALLQRCDVVVSGETLGSHLATALGVPAVVLFGPTCPQEVDLFGLGRKIQSRIPCSPCWKRDCTLNPDCMDMIEVEEVEEAVLEVLEEHRTYNTQRRRQLAGPEPLPPWVEDATDSHH